MDISAISNAAVAVTTLASLFISLWVFFTQVKHARESLSASILREYEQQFFYSPPFLAARVATCHFLRAQIEKGLTCSAVRQIQDADGMLPDAAWQVIDFLDSLATAANRGTVDADMAFSKFFYFYHRYWVQLEGYLAHSRFRKLDGDVDYYVDLEIFYKELIRHGTKSRGLKLSDYTKQQVDDFFDYEVAMNSNASSELAVRTG